MVGPVVVHHNQGLSTAHSPNCAFEAAHDRLHKPLDVFTVCGVKNLVDELFLRAPKSSKQCQPSASCACNSCSDRWVYLLPYLPRKTPHIECGFVYIIKFSLTCIHLYEHVLTKFKLFLLERISLLKFLDACLLHQAVLDAKGLVKVGKCAGVDVNAILEP